MRTLDAFVSNAGISQRSLAESTSLPTAERIMNVNFMSSIALVQVCIPYLKQTKGQIAVTSSLQGIIGNPVRSVYSASKHALHGYYNSLRAELSPFAVSVTVICPDYVRTNLAQRAVSKRNLEPL
jgi:dehydrogenase/reductase SDR family protein 7B